MKRSHVTVRDDLPGNHLVSCIATARQARGSFLRIRYRDGFRLPLRALHASSGEDRLKRASELSISADRKSTNRGLEAGWGGWCSRIPPSCRQWVGISVGRIPHGPGVARGTLVQRSL